MSSKGWNPPVLILAAAVAAVVAVAPAMAQTPPPSPQILHHPFDPLRDCLRILDLSDAQKADIKAIFEAVKPQVEAFAANLKADRDTLKADLSKNPPDPCAVGTDVLQLHTDREAARAFFESVRDQILAVLTPGQKAKLAGCLEAPASIAIPAADGTGPSE